MLDTCHIVYQGLPPLTCESLPDKALHRSVDMVVAILVSCGEEDLVCMPQVKAGNGQSCQGCCAAVQT